jgi:hypothetical protein
MLERLPCDAGKLSPDPSDVRWAVDQSACKAGTVTATDGDLQSLSREQLVQEVVRLRDGIRRHRDSTRDELCWHHPRLWGLLPDATDPVPEVPEWPQFLRGCVRYRESLDEQLPAAPRIDDEYRG